MAVLQKWRERLGPHATYRRLATAFYEADNVIMAEEVCRVLCSRTDLPTQATNMRVGSYSQLRKGEAISICCIFLDTFLAPATIVLIAVALSLWGYHPTSNTNIRATEPGLTDLEEFSLHDRSGRIAENNLPHIPGPFVGRDSDLLNISHTLLHSRYTNIKTVGIYGPPAMGKSTLAIHVGYEMAMNGIQVRYINVNDAHHLFKDTSSEGTLNQPHKNKSPRH